MQHQGVIGCDEAIDLIGEQIAAHACGILTALAPFEAMSAIETWHGIIRDIEEFINVLMTGIDDNRLLAPLSTLPLGEAMTANPLAQIDSRNTLPPFFGPDIARRSMTRLFWITRTKC